MASRIDVNVVKSNDLILNSRFNLTVQQQKILLFLIAQIRFTDTEFKWCEFEIVDFCRACDISRKGNNYNLLRQSIKDIADKSVWVTLPDGRETLLRWIEKPYIDKKNGTIRIRLDEDMKPYLLQLRDKFTQYNLISALSFKSKYSLHCYEFLKCILHSADSTCTFHSVSYVAKQLHSPYEEFRDFRSRVLDKAVSELNEVSDIFVEYELKRTGRKITHIFFKVRQKHYSDYSDLAQFEKMANIISYNQFRRGF